MTKSTVGPMRRLSMALGFSKPPPPPLATMANAACSPTLAIYLSASKSNFLKDIAESPKNGKKWTVVMGNEAGDLDSIASAVGYAWYLSEVCDTPAVPLIQIAKEDFALRAENLYALELAGISDPQTHLLSTSDIADIQPFPAETKFALVDHNRLAAQYASSPGLVIRAVIDHHEDEGLYKESANPRLIKPAGSCASLVASVLPAAIPPELATLLLAAIVIDTNACKPGGKATDDDRTAARRLAAQSTLGITSLGLGDNLPDSDVHGDPAVKALSKTLSEKKTDLSHLAGWDLLRRDYKEYTHPLPWAAAAAAAAGAPTIKVGLATVPVELKTWGSGGRLETDSLAWMQKRGLTVLGVLTTFNSDAGKKEKEKGKKGDKGKGKGKGKGKHKREMAWIVLPDERVDAAALAARLWAGLEQDKTLQVKRHKKFKQEQRNNSLPEGSHVRVYKQKNADATRKAVAPLVKAILEATMDGPAKL